LNQQFRHRQFPAGNPLANILVVIVGIIVISLSLALGFVVFLGIAGFVLVMGVVMSVRNWWLRRQFQGKPQADRASHGATPASRQIIEGEFQEVSGKDDGRPQA
jgi:hypothetical protein